MLRQFYVQIRSDQHRVLSWLIVIWSVVTITVQALVLVYLDRHFKQRAGDTIALIASETAGRIDRVLFERYGDIQMMARAFGPQTHDQHYVMKYLTWMTDAYPVYRLIAVADREGHIIASSDPAKIGTDSQHAEWFQQTRVSQKVMVHDFRRFEEIDAFAVGFSAPILDQAGQLQGVVFSLVGLPLLVNMFEESEQVISAGQHSSPRLEYLILRPTGDLVLDSLLHQEGQANLKQLPSFQRLLASPQAGYVEEEAPRWHRQVFTGYAMTTGYGSFPGMRWAVLVRANVDEIRAPITTVVLLVGLMGVLVYLPALLLLFYVTRQLQRADAEKEKLVAELRRSNADLQQFAYVASHDLQEPLRMVASYTQLLAKRYAGALDTDADEFIGYAVDGANRMQRLIQDLLSYSRITMQDRPLESVDCHQALASALGNLRMTIEKEQAVVTHDPLPTVLADPTQLIQLFQNLIGNAIKFRGAPPPRVHVSAARKDTEWVCAVRDNGIGIEPEFAERIFVIFQRLHTSANYPGTGIGLALCRKIVERHGGRIWVESEAAHGTTFYFTWPFTP